MCIRDSFTTVPSIQDNLFVSLQVEYSSCFRAVSYTHLVFDLMFSLEATEDQLDFPVIYGSAKNNWMSTDWKTPTDNIFALLDCIVENIPAPRCV